MPPGERIEYENIYYQTKLEKYPWSSYPAYLNLASSPEWLNREEIYQLLGYAQRYKGYRAYVELGVDEEITTIYGKKNHPAIIGSKGFKEQIYADTVNKKIVLKLKKREPEKPNSKKIVEAVARWMNVDELEIYHGEREAASCWVDGMLLQLVAEAAVN